MCRENSHLNPIASSLSAGVGWCQGGAVKGRAENIIPQQAVRSDALERSILMVLNRHLRQPGLTVFLLASCAY